MEDQARWWDDQRRDEEELQQMRIEVLRDQIRREMEEEVYTKLKPELDQAAVKFGRIVYRTGFVMGFCAALVGAGLFFYFF
jgi:hypothetical protein